MTEQVEAGAVIPAEKMTSVEVAELQDCERKIRLSFINVGNALTAIRDKKLYRGSHKTFEAYCAERWGYKKSMVYRLITSVGVMNNLEKSPQFGDILPMNEAQARPLYQLDDDMQQEAWREAIETAPKTEAGDPIITARHIESTVEKLTVKQAKRPTPPPPTQDVIDLRELHKIAKTIKELPYSGVNALEKYGAEALGEDVLLAAQWFADLWYQHRGDVDVSIPLSGGSYFHPSAEDVEIWKKAYPLLDVMAELRKCAAWNDANPTKRKTHKGIKKHIVYWLGNQKPVAGNEGAEDRAVFL